MRFHKYQGLGNDYIVLERAGPRRAGSTSRPRWSAGSATGTTVSAPTASS